MHSELDVFRAARAWIDHARETRMAQCSDVMQCVRFVHIPPEEVARHVESHVAYFKGQGGRGVLLDIYRYGWLFAFKVFGMFRVFYH